MRQINITGVARANKLQTVETLAFFIITQKAKFLPAQSIKTKTFSHECTNFKTKLLAVNFLLIRAFVAKVRNGINIKTIILVCKCGCPC